MKIVINAEMPDLNKIIKISKQHWAKYSKTKKQYTDLVAYIAKTKKVNEINKPVYIIFRWYCKNKMKDPDNIAAGKKFILDGLVKAGVLKDDRWGHIRGFKDEFYIDNKSPRIEVDIKEGK